MDAWTLINAHFSDDGGTQSRRSAFRLIQGLSADDQRRFATELIAIICDPKHGFEYRSAAIDILRGLAVQFNIHRSKSVAEQFAEVLKREFVYDMVAYVAKVHGDFLGFSPCVNFYQGLLRTVIVIDYELGKEQAERVLPMVKNTSFEEWLRGILQTLGPDLK